MSPTSRWESTVFLTYTSKFMICWTRMLRTDGTISRVSPPLCPFNPSLEGRSCPPPNTLGKGTPLHHLIVRQLQALDLLYLAPLKATLPIFTLSVNVSFERLSYLISNKWEKNFPQLISASPDFHWDVAATGVQLRGGLGRISQMAERRAIHQPTEISHAIWFKY